MRNPREFIADFYTALEREYDGKNPFLDSEENRIFRKYYGALRNKFRRYLYKNLYHSRLRYITSLLLSLRNTDILDAGCGLGSESLLFSSLGANVLGVDLNEVRLKVAKKRKLFYRDLMKGKLEFVLGNVFEVIKKQKFDIVWMNESISHIHPAEDFLRLAHEQLNPGGRVIISEGNGGNPYILLKRILKTGSWSWTPYFVKTPEANGRVGYAIERLFTVKEIRDILTEAGYFITHLEFTYFLSIFSIGRFEKSGLITKLEQLLKRRKFGPLAALSYRIEGKV